MHSGTNPVEWIKLAACPGGHECDNSQQWAWYETKTQRRLASNEIELSVTNGKLIKAKCEKREQLRSNLLAGRYCESDYECKSFKCKDNRC